MGTTVTLTDQQRVDVRRFCGYPPFGTSAMPVAGYRFFQAYGMLEYRMTNMSDNELTTLINTYLTPLYNLEAGIPAAASNLDTDQAAVWHHNKDEIPDRAQLFDLWRRHLCFYLGVPPGEGLVEQDRRGG